MISSFIQFAAWGLKRLSEWLAEKIIEKTKSVFGLIRLLAMVAARIMIVWVYGIYVGNHGDAIRRLIF